MKITKYFLFICLFYLAILFVSSCSSDVSKESTDSNDSKKEVVAEVSKKNNDLQIEISSLSSWVNLMPGSEKPKFHISGDIAVLSSEEYELNVISIKSIVISQQNKEIYFIRPAQEEGDLLQSAKTKQIRFSTLKGLILIDDLDSDLPVDVEFIFTDDNKEYSYYIDNLIIEKAY